MLKNLNIPKSLTTSKNDLIKDFFLPLLENSIKYDRGVGFFTSNWIKEASIGMYTFANNGGKARWITSPILFKDDWEAMVLGEEAKNNDVLFKSLNRSIIDLEEKLDQDTLIALAWMVADEIITFKLAKPKNQLDGEFHAKVGVFTDLMGDKISFDGSYNDSKRGLHNYESIKVFRSWDNTRDYVLSEVESFEKLWNNLDPNITVFDIPNATKEEIVKIRKEFPRPYQKPSWVITIRDDVNSHPNISKIPSIPDNLKLREYQIKAIDNWADNNYRGILEMATGTGKTFTALYGMLELLKKKKRVLSIICCPYVHLVTQWQDECEKFDFWTETAVQSKSVWENKISEKIRFFNKHLINNLIIITTNDTFISDTFQQYINNLNVGENSLLIVDEVHHAGSSSMIKKIPNNIPFRLGLSATPEREYDEIGTNFIISFFEKIVYTFTMEQAISGGYLTPYNYFPILVPMSHSEFDDYVKLSKKLQRFINKEEDPISDAALKIAIARARILNNSINKIQWIKDNIEPNKIEFTLFYVGERIFKDIKKILGIEKRIPIHEFTHRQNKLQRKNILELFAKGQIKALLAMKCLDEGVDVPPTRKAYFLASSSVSREFIQRRGRILRPFPGKINAIIYDLISIPPYDYLYDDEYRDFVKSALRREFKRVKQFASLAQNNYQSINSLYELLNRLEMLDL